MFRICPRKRHWLHVYWWKQFGLDNIIFTYDTLGCELSVSNDPEVWQTSVVHRRPDVWPNISVLWEECFFKLNIQMSGIKIPLQGAFLHTIPSSFTEPFRFYTNLKPKNYVGIKYIIPNKISLHKAKNYKSFNKDIIKQNINGLFD